MKIYSLYHFHYTSQLCINFANEKLQQYFTNYVFKLEIELYKREGVDYSSITFTDNQTVISLVEDKVIYIYIIFLFIII
jgi:myosin-5